MIGRTTTCLLYPIRKELDIPAIETMNKRRLSAVELLRQKTNERHSLEAHFSSLTDDEFEKELATEEDADYVRSVILTVPLREENIAHAKETQLLCISSKEIHNALKTQTPHQISELLCSLDDSTFKCMAKHERVKQLILDSPSMSQRLSAIEQ